jgi:hypothetical protein
MLSAFAGHRLGVDVNVGLDEIVDGLGETRGIVWWKWKLGVANAVGEVPGQVTTRVWLSSRWTWTT